MRFLPSERKLAKEAGISRNTVIKAYHELADDGLVAAAQGRGYQIIHKRNMREGNTANKKASGIAWEFLVKDEYKFPTNTFNGLVARSYDERLISFAGGILPPESYYKEDIRSTLLEILSSGREDIYQYAPYQGLPELRHNISDYLKKKGIYAKPSEIQIFSEPNHAFECLLNLFVSPGDAVFAEEPASPEIYDTLKLSGARIVTIPLTGEGADTQTIETLITKYKPKLIYTSASFHDPTGIMTGPEGKRQLLEISSRYKIPIIEEDASSELYFSQKNGCCAKALDRQGNVIYVYSYALTFPPGFKLSYVVAPRQVIKRLSYLISVYFVSIDSLTQVLMSDFLKTGKYQKNLAFLRALLREKRDLMCEGLAEAQNLGLEFVKPEGGVYLWCKLPKAVDPVKLMHHAHEQGVTFMPGNLFFLNGSEGSSFFRLNYSYPSAHQIEQGTDRLTRSLKKSVKESLILT